MTKTLSNNQRGRPALPKALKCGTTTGYAQGCRCDRCRAAWATYQREYNARPDVQTRRALKALQSTPEGREALKNAAGDAEARAAWIAEVLL